MLTRFFLRFYKHCNIFILQMLAFCSGGLVRIGEKFYFEIRENILEIQSFLQINF